MKCSVEVCDRPAKERGMCHTHYEYNRRHGYPVPLPRPTVLERILSRIIEVNGCWLWLGATGSSGHGHLCIVEDGRKRWRPTHRMAYQLLVEPVPDHLDVDHLCRNPPCVNPAHLEPVTRRENLLRGIGLAAQNAAKTHCPRGHEYSPENTYITYKPKTGTPMRCCRTCSREKAAERRQAARRFRCPECDTEWSCEGDALYCCAPGFIRLYGLESAS